MSERTAGAATAECIIQWIKDGESQYMTGHPVLIQFARSIAIPEIEQRILTIDRPYRILAIIHDAYRDAHPAKRRDAECVDVATGAAFSWEFTPNWARVYIHDEAGLAAHNRIVAQLQKDGYV